MKKEELDKKLYWIRDGVVEYVVKLSQLTLLELKVSKKLEIKKVRIKELEKMREIISDLHSHSGKLFQEITELKKKISK